MEIHARSKGPTVAGFTGSVRQLRRALVPGCRLSLLTDGSFSMLDILRAAADACGGPVDLWLSTWTVGIRDIENVGMLTDSGIIRSLRIVVDAGFARLKPEHCAELIGHHGEGAVRLTKTHAKVATVEGNGLDFCIRGSLNLNRNTRFENVDIEEGGDLPRFWRRQLEAVSSVLKAGDLAGDAAGFQAACRACDPLPSEPPPVDFKPAVLAAMAAKRAAREPIGKLPALARACRLSIAELRQVLTTGGTPQQRAIIWSLLG